MNAGEPIELKEGESRQVADVFGVKVIQDSTGGLRFEDREGAEEEIGKSSVIVPEKGEYFVILSDGTKVWINSDSELEFPNRFGEDIREVKLKGEAYFEVTSDSRKPFYVLAGETKVHVLGTAFNVSAYREDRTCSRGDCDFKSGKWRNDCPERRCGGDSGLEGGTI